MCAASDAVRLRGGGEGHPLSPSNLSPPDMRRWLGGVPRCRRRAAEKRRRKEPRRPHPPALCPAFPPPFLTSVPRVCLGRPPKTYRREGDTPPQCCRGAGVTGDNRLGLNGLAAKGGAARQPDEFLAIQKKIIRGLVEAPLRYSWTQIVVRDGLSRMAAGEPLVLEDADGASWERKHGTMRRTSKEGKRSSEVIPSSWAAAWPPRPPAVLGTPLAESRAPFFRPPSGRNTRQQ